MSSILKRNNVNIIGNGQQVMLFAHGFGCDQRSWQFVVDAFSDDYRVVLFDYVGSGQSDLSQYSSAKYGSLDGYAQDVLDVCEALSLQDVIFVGHSVSSMIGLLAAVQQPAYFKKLIFIGPSPRYLNDQDYTGGFERSDMESLFDFMESNYLGWSSTMAPAIMGNADRPELGAFLTSSFCATDPEVAREFARVTFFSDNRDDLTKLGVKSLTLQCSDDIIAPVAVGEFVKTHTPGNEFVMLNATGHCPHISEPQETIKAIKAFI
ncbi:alpha/beta hydrolase [Mucilaginibacter sp. 14171R-50]|uniref:alpha/beta fold hydrolase n=1 Tax=Mucilaginibacter sp. 14171R-50 TaxID=2703789 RepID=UPI00138C5BBD|nr:alpha/beta hydrolase [Mucilaginibacter sp. 14171R-50]QHS55832.1 alpha/beta hydrolase [Mucilaginibacter sp. 14171R-50]